MEQEEAGWRGGRGARRAPGLQKGPVRRCDKGVTLAEEGALVGRGWQPPSGM